MEILNGKSREKNKGHYSKEKRNNGLVPGVLYGPEIRNTLFEIGELELKKEIKKQGDHGTLNINLNNENHKAMIKEVQREPVTQKIIHIDLEEVSDEQIVSVEVPIKFIGEELVIKKGGIAEKEKNDIKVKGKYKEIPKFIQVDLSKIDIGSVYRVENIKLQDDLIIEDDLDSGIAAVNWYKSNNELEEEEDEEEE